MKIEISKMLILDAADAVEVPVRITEQKQFNNQSAVITVNVGLENQTLSEIKSESLKRAQLFLIDALESVSAMIDDDAEKAIS